MGDFSSVLYWFPYWEKNPCFVFVLFASQNSIMFTLYANPQFTWKPDYYFPDWQPESAMFLCFRCVMKMILCFWLTLFWRTTSVNVTAKQLPPCGYDSRCNDKSLSNSCYESTFSKSILYLKSYFSSITFAYFNHMWEWRFWSDFQCQKMSQSQLSRRASTQRREWWPKI